MAAAGKCLPGSKHVRPLHLAAVPPIMCSTWPRSVTTRDMATLLHTNTVVSRAEAHWGIDLMSHTASNRSCTATHTAGAEACAHVQCLVVVDDRHQVPVKWIARHVATLLHVFHSFWCCWEGQLQPASLHNTHQHHTSLFGAVVCGPGTAAAHTPPVTS
jgi:hypothetical protein